MSPLAVFWGFYNTHAFEHDLVNVGPCHATAAIV